MGFDKYDNRVELIMRDVRGGDGYDSSSSSSGDEKMDEVWSANEDEFYSDALVDGFDISVSILLATDVAAIDDQKHTQGS